MLDGEQLGCRNTPVFRGWRGIYANVKLGKQLPTMNTQTQPLSEENQALITLLIYCGFATLAVILLALAWWVREKRKEFNRKDHLLDMWALRIREMGLLIETVWQRTKP